MRSRVAIILAIILVVSVAVGSLYAFRRGTGPGQGGAGGSPMGTQGSEACLEARPGLVVLMPNYITYTPDIIMLLADNGTFRLWGSVDLDYFAKIVQEVRGEQFNFTKIPEYVNDTAIMDRVMQALNYYNLTISPSNIDRFLSLIQRNQTLISHFQDKSLFLFWILYPALPSTTFQGSCESTAKDIMQKLNDILNILQMKNVSIPGCRMENISNTRKNIEVEIEEKLKEYCCYNGPTTIPARVLNLTLNNNNTMTSIYYLLNNGIALAYLNPETGNISLLTVMTAFSKPVADASSRFHDKITELFRNATKSETQENTGFETIHIYPDSKIWVDNSTLILHIANSGNAAAVITKIEVFSTTVYPDQPANVSGNAYIEGNTIVVPAGGEAWIRISLEGTGLQVSKGVAYNVYIRTASGSIYLDVVYGY